MWEDGVKNIHCEECRSNVGCSFLPYSFFHYFNYFGPYLEWDHFVANKVTRHICNFLFLLDVGAFYRWNSRRVTSSDQLCINCATEIRSWKFYSVRQYFNKSNHHRLIRNCRNGFNSHEFATTTVYRRSGK